MPRKLLNIDDAETTLREAHLRHTRQTLTMLLRAYDSNPTRVLRLVAAVANGAIDYLRDTGIGQNIEAEEDGPGPQRRDRGRNLFMQPAVPPGGLGGLGPALDAQRLHFTLRSLRDAQDIGDDALAARLRSEVDALMPPPPLPPEGEAMANGDPSDAPDFPEVP